jgi:hypothetical protein
VCGGGAVTLVYLAETINAVLFSHWQLFSRQNYFDPSGFFISMVSSCPNILLLLVLLVRPASPRGQTLGDAGGGAAMQRG